MGPLRVSDEDEVEGLNLAEHSESGYGFHGGTTIAPEAAAQGGGGAMRMIGRAGASRLIC